MLGKVKAFCRKKGLRFDMPPVFMPYSQKSWLVEDRDGGKWAAKLQEDNDQTTTTLDNFKFLHAPFIYPRPISGQGDAFLLYRYIPGVPLADGYFEERDIVEEVFELVARFGAMMRTMILAPFYRKSMDTGNKQSDKLPSPVYGITHEATQGKSDPENFSLRTPMPHSFLWARRQSELWCASVRSADVWKNAGLDLFLEKLNKVISIHVPVFGSNFSHTAMQPEHLLRCSDERLAVVGWHIAPRPRFYMMYTYLAWSLFYSAGEDIEELCRKYSARDKAGDFFREHQLVLALCLLEQMAKTQSQGVGDEQRNAQRIDRAGVLFRECVENA